jgi:hypothetical protein
LSEKYKRRDVLKGLAASAAALGSGKMPEISGQK